jgi:hypothetical protein
LFIGDTLAFNDIPSLKGLYFQPTNHDEPPKSLGIKTENTPRSVVSLVDMFNCHINAWPHITERLPDMTPKWIVVRCVFKEKKCNKDTTNISI